MNGLTWGCFGQGLLVVAAIMAIAGVYLGYARFCIWLADTFDWPEWVAVAVALLPMVVGLACLIGMSICAENR